jgi:hypothetical protein
MHVSNTTEQTCYPTRSANLEDCDSKTNTVCVESAILN